MLRKIAVCDLRALSSGFADDERIRYSFWPAVMNKPSASALHESVRTAISTNRDPYTGEQQRVMTTSRLLMAWEAGELRVRFQASRMELDAQRVPARRTRGRL